VGDVGQGELIQQVPPVRLQVPREAASSSRIRSSSTSMSTPDSWSIGTTNGGSLSIRRRPSSMAARARPTQPPARAHSPRFINPKTSQDPARAAPSGSPCRIRSRNERSSSDKESSSRPVR
jgi:hypothetical protein